MSIVTAWVLFLINDSKQEVLELSDVLPDILNTDSDTNEVNLAN